MKSIRYILLIIAAAMFAGCEKEIEFEGDFTDPQIVVVSQPEADSTWMIRLTWSRFFLDQRRFETIDDAVVTLTRNGVAAGTAQAIGDGMYDTHIQPAPGDKLALQVTLRGEVMAKASCSIPQRPQVGKVEVSGDTSIYTYTDYYIDHDTTIYDTTIQPTILLTLNDPAGEENYYCVEVYRLTHVYGFEEDIWQKVSIEIDDNVLFDENVETEIFGEGELENYGSSLLFSDERINGSSHTLKISFWEYGNATHKLVLRSMSRELYLYQKSLRSQESSDGIFSEPVQIISNIEGGIGILGGSAAYVYNL